jgi:2-keto-3-deoxy-L-rhamnonate aldolase RhmA
MNKTKAKIKAGIPVIGTSVSIDNEKSNLIMANAGFDFLLLDMQHSTMTVEVLDRIIGRLLQGSSDVIVRVLWNDGPLINQALDIGADGVIIPMVNSAPEAANAVRYSKYDPMGTRSWTPLRPEKYGGADSFFRVANDELLVLPQIETTEAIEELDNILAVDGLDGVLIGPGDLAISLGHSPDMGYDINVPEVMEVMAQVQARCEDKGVPFGTFTGPMENAEYWVDRGAKIIITEIDLSFLASGAAKARDRIYSRLDGK